MGIYVAKASAIRELLMKHYPQARRAPRRGGAARVPRRAPCGRGRCGTLHRFLFCAENRITHAAP